MGRLRVCFDARSSGFSHLCFSDFKQPFKCPIVSIDFDIGEDVTVIDRSENELILAFGERALNSVFRQHKKFHYFVHVDPEICDISDLEDKFIICKFFALVERVNFSSARNEESVGIMKEMITVTEETTWPTEAFYVPI